MPWCILALLAFWPFFAQADEAKTDWSKPVNGLRGRLIIPAHQDRGNDPFVHVYLELQNTANVLGNRKIRYSEEALSMQITDETGKALSPYTGPYDGISATPEPLVMPFDSTLRFLVNGHGLGVPPGTHQIIDFGVPHSWIIPTLNGHTYFLSGTLTLPRNPRELPTEHPSMDWHGILELPKVQITKD
jgi:hypothetical protein